MLGLVVGPQNDDWKKLLSWMKQLEWESVQVAACVLGRKELELNPSIDLVIIDADSADDCGLKLIGIMKNDPRLLRIPILVAGESIDQDLAIKYAALGVDNIMLLPTVKETFEAKLRKADLYGKPKVLVVDDEEMIRELLSDFLTLERYSPITASNVDEAMEVIRSRTIDAIVTDIMMPGKTGIDLLIEVKQSHPQIPVILITGLSQRYGPKEVIAMGADGYFAKPFHNVELAFTLRRVIGNRSRLARSASRAHA